MGNTTYTFWKLINEHSIEIPIIQRDYAQGRNTAKEIRDTFIDDIKSHLTTGNPLDIDFVYGSVLSGKFIPLDGQQRLTTLFLLHWYLAIQDGKHDDIVAVLTKFSYETRTTSRVFCEFLIKKQKNIVELKGSFSSHIKDAAWFFSSWKKDPTIKSMLVMIDAIHSSFNNLSGMFEKLINSEQPMITFQFIELKEFGLTDNLYIKMNARGKPLTSFENFKAKIEQLIQKFDKANNTDKAEEFSRKMDMDWTDLFWNYRNEKTNLFDEQLLNFFRVSATNHFAIKHELANNIEDGLRLLRDNKKDLSFAKYESLDCFDPEYIDYITDTLDHLKNGTRSINIFLPQSYLLNEETLFSAMIENTLDYAGLVTFYGLTQYINYYNVKDSEDEGLKEWMRIIINLVEGSRLTYYNNAREYAGSLKSIKALLPHGKTILNYVANPQNAISGFVGLQIEEERIKANLILLNPSWKEKIIKMEGHGYFKGQIGFLFHFSGITPDYELAGHFNWSEDEYRKFESKLDSYYEKSAFVFDKDGLRAFSDKFLWERALLCKGEYLLKKGQNYSFLINSERDISWKRLLRDNNKERNCVKILLDAIDITSFEDDLQRIIDDVTATDNWRYNFIKHPGTIKICNSNKFIRKQSSKDILLLESSTVSGYNNEYYTYALYLKIKKGAQKYHYEHARGAYSDKYVSINNDEVVIYHTWVDKSVTGKEPAWMYTVVVNGTDIAEYINEVEVLDFLNSYEYNVEVI